MVEKVHLVKDVPKQNPISQKANKIPVYMFLFFEKYIKIVFLY